MADKNKIILDLRDSNFYSVNSNELLLNDTGFISKGHRAKEGSSKVVRQFTAEKDSNLYLANFSLSISSAEFEQVVIIVEEISAPWKKFVFKNFWVSSNPVLISLPFRIDNDLSKFNIVLQHPNSIDLSLSNFQIFSIVDSDFYKTLQTTKPNYLQFEESDWKIKALERIELHRKQNVRLNIGREICESSYEYNIQQISSDFIFGTAVNLKFWNADSEYRNRIRSIFNGVVLESALKFNSGADQEDIDSFHFWASKHRLYVRGHNVLWPSWDKNGFSDSDIQNFKSDPDLLKSWIRNRVVNFFEVYEDSLSSVDLINEPFTSSDFSSLLTNSFIFDSFDHIDKNKDVTLFINDFGLLVNHNDPRSDHVLFIDKLLTDLVLKYGKEYQLGLGIQSHFNDVLTSPTNIYKVLDLFSKHEVGIQITEFDHDSQDNELQARYIEDFLITIFSHPSVNAFYMWGFWDGAHWKSNAPLFDLEWNIKPSGKVFIDLIKSKWTSNYSGSLSCDPHFRLFKGSYKLTIFKNGHSFSRYFHSSDELITISTEDFGYPSSQ